MSEIEAFRSEVKEFLARELTADLQAAAKLGFGIHREAGARWHKKLYDAGWIAPNWCAG